MQGRSARPPTVVYIAGSGRSGSTLVERVLGGIPGMTNVGELIDLARRTAPAGERCGCGLAFGDCPFWTKVGAARLRRLGRRPTGRARAVAHARRTAAVPAQAAGHVRWPTAASAPTWRSYGASYAAIYQAVADTDGTTCVVDASKLPAQALALARAGIDVRVVHLVRDARGVAYSLGKQVSRPHAVNAAEQMSGSLPAEAAGRWLAIQAEAEMLRRCGMPVARVLYEDFVRQPRPVIEAALTRLGLPPEPVGPGPHWRRAGCARPQPWPVRQSIALHAKESQPACRRGLASTACPAVTGSSVTALALPLLLRYRQFRWPGSTARECGR